LYPGLRKSAWDSVGDVVRRSTFVEAAGFSVVREFVGHGSAQVHEERSAELWHSDMCKRGGNGVAIEPW